MGWNAESAEAYKSTKKCAAHNNASDVMGAREAGGASGAAVVEADDKGNYYFSGVPKDTYLAARVRLAHGLHSVIG